MFEIAEGIGGAGWIILGIFGGLMVGATILQTFFKNQGNWGKVLSVLAVGIVALWGVFSYVQGGLYEIDLNEDLAEVRDGQYGP